MKSGCPSSTSSTARLVRQKSTTSSGYQGIGDVHHIEGNAAGAPDVSQAEPCSGAQHAVVHAALQD